MSNESSAIGSSMLLPCRNRKYPSERPPGGAKSLRLGLALVLAFGAVGCGSNNVWVYVDNGGQEPMVVTVDGKEEAAIAPGEFAKLEFEPGEKHFHVHSGDKVLFDGTKDLVKSDKLGVCRRYFFNPDNHNRYAIYTVQYGESPLEGLFDRLSDQSGADRQSTIRTAYQKLAKEIEVQPSDPWFEITASCYVLSSPPEMVVTRGYTERRKVLTRVDRKDYDLLKAARSKENPTEEDLDALAEVVDRVSD
jgi:hypothetical protein